MMSIIVAMKFAIPPAQANAGLAANPTVIPVLGAAMERLGGMFLLRLEHDHEFIDLDEWPSAEVYETFLTEERAALDAFEAAVGSKAIPEIWTAWRAPDAP